MNRYGIVRYAALSIVGIVGATAIAVGMAGRSGASVERIAKPVVYETKVVCCQTIVLGSSQNATLIATSPSLPVGKYLMQATVAVVMGPNDNVACATAPSSIGGNDGIFGSAGNGATESGQGANGVAGSATIVDTWNITTPGDTVYLYCWVGHYGMGTYASQGVIALEKLGTLVGG
jgi:hypothetical protein